jgi:hypothetical protein
MHVRYVYVQVYMHMHDCTISYYVRIEKVRIAKVLNGSMSFL